MLNKLINWLVYCVCCSACSQFVAFIRLSKRSENLRTTETNFLDTIRQNSFRQSFPVNQFLFQQGDLIRDVYLLEKGIVKMTRNARLQITEIRVSTGTGLVQEFRRACDWRNEALSNLGGSAAPARFRFLQ